MKAKVMDLEMMAHRLRGTAWGLRHWLMEIYDGGGGSEEERKHQDSEQQFVLILIDEIEAQAEALQRHVEEVGKDARLGA